MGKGIAIVVTAFILLGTFYQAIRSSSELESRRKIANSQYETIARNAAISGLNAARQYISDFWFANKANANATKKHLLTAKHGEASYTAKISIAGPKAIVHVVATIGNASDKQTLYSVWSEFNREAVVPEFMGEAVVTDGNLEVKYDFTLDSFDSNNANVRVNGNIEMKSGDISIRGFGYHAGNASAENGDKLTDIFDPYTNPGWAPVTQKVKELKIPDFKAEDYASIATKSYYSDLKIGGTFPLGTRDNPAIIYVEGNLRTTSDVTFTGYGVFILTGNVEVHHNVSSDAGSESTVGIYANGNIYVENGGLSLAGQWLTNGNVKLQANTTLTGTITSQGNVEIHGPFTMHYRGASSGLTDPFWYDDFSMTLVSIYEE